MEPSEKDLLDKTYRLARDNNRMLHVMRRNAFLGTVFRIILWVAVAGLSFWAYTEYLHPILSSMMEAIGQMQETGTEFSEQFQELSETVNRLLGRE